MSSAPWARLLLFSAFLFPLAACDGDGSTDDRPSLPQGSEVLVYDGLQRTYQLFVPASYTAGTTAPLLLAFHGQGDTALNMRALTGLDEEAERLGMVVAYLDDYASDWAEGCGCTRAESEGVDDLGFARTVVDTLRASYAIDPERIYAVGFSTGGMMVQRLACEAADAFAAVAVVSATMSVPLSQTCRPDRPVSVMIQLGTEDASFPWDGTQNGALSLLGARAAVDAWRGHNACTGEAQVSEASITASLRLREEVYAPCQGATEVRLTALEGGQHAWYRGSYNTSARVVAFLAAQRKP